MLECQFVCNYFPTKHFRPNTTTTTTDAAPYSKANEREYSCSSLTHMLQEPGHGFMMLFIFTWLSGQGTLYLLRADVSPPPLLQLNSSSFTTNPLLSFWFSSRSDITVSHALCPSLVPLSSPSPPLVGCFRQRYIILIHQSYSCHEHDGGVALLHWNQNTWVQQRDVTSQ